MAISSNAIMIYGIPAIHIVIFAVLMIVLIYLIYRTKKK